MLDVIAIRSLPFICWPESVTQVRQNSIDLKKPFSAHSDN